MAAGSLSARICRCGIALALAGAAVQALLHLVNVYALDRRFEAFDVDLVGEGNAFTWASSSATFAAAVFCLVLALTGGRQRVVFGALAATLAFFSLDDATFFHERWALKLVDVAGLQTSHVRVVWPVFMLPLLAFVALTLWRAAAGASRDERRVLRGGTGLLGFAVAVELALFPAREGSRLYELIEPSFVAVEESAELAGWILVAAGLGAILVHRIALDSRREALDRRGRDDHPPGLALAAGERRLRGLRRG